MVGHHPRPELQLLAAKHQLQHEHPAQLLRVPGTGHRESGRPDVAPSLLLQRVFVEPRFQSEVGLDQKTFTSRSTPPPMRKSKSRTFRSTRISMQTSTKYGKIPYGTASKDSELRSTTNRTSRPRTKYRSKKNTVLLVDFPRRQLHGQLFLGTRHGTGRRNFLRQYHQQPAFGYDKRTLQPGNAVQFLFFPERGQQEILGQRTEESQGQKQP